MPLISENNCCADRSIAALLSAYHERLVTLKSMTSQVEQRERPLSGDIWLLGRQRVRPFIFIRLVILTVVTSP